MFVNRRVNIGETWWNQGLTIFIQGQIYNPETSSFESFPRWAIPSTIVILSKGEIENNTIYTWVTVVTPRKTHLMVIYLGFV